MTNSQTTMNTWNGVFFEKTNKTGKPLARLNKKNYKKKLLKSEMKKAI